MINISNEKNITNLISIENFSLHSILNNQKVLNKNILIFMKDIMDRVELCSSTNPSDTFLKYINDSVNIFNKSTQNITLLTKLLSELTNLNKKNTNEKTAVEKYNKNFEKAIKKVQQNTEDIEKFLKGTECFDFSILNDNLNSLDILKDIDKQEKSVKSSLNVEDSNSEFVENTLIISEISKKVILPYKLEDIRKILEDSTEFISVEGIIEKFYTKPISYYKFSSIARFKEAYFLIRNKEKGSIQKALSLATELFFNYNLHPAIITACKSLDELDIYLACLETNTLDDFHFFNIKYEIPPSVLRNSNSII